MKTFRTTMPWLSAFLLLGCATSADYVEPTGKKTAILAMLNESAFPARPALYGSAAECRNRSVLPSIPVGEQTDVRVKAGEDLALTMTMRQRTSTRDEGTICDITVVFKPEPGRRYMANASYQSDACNVLITDITSLLEPKAVNVAGKVTTKATSAEGPWCK